MANLFLRILIAAVCVLALFAVIPAFLNIIGYQMSGDLNTIFRVVVAVLAVLYVIGGPPVRNPLA